MKVSINSIAYAGKDKQVAGQPPVQKSDLKTGTRFAFLVSMLDATNATPVDIAFDDKDSAGKPIPNFTRTFELWFETAERDAILAALNAAKAEGMSLHYTFTCSSTSKMGAPYANAKGELSQTIILNQNASEPRHAQKVAKPAITFG